MTDFTDIIARLEVLAGHDRYIDQAIHALAYPDEPKHIVAGDYPPRYTASIDAALMLVPEGWAWSVREGGCYATGRLLKPHAELSEPVQTQFGPGVGVRAQIDAATPAIALCIAALKARALLHSEGDAK